DIPVNKYIAEHLEKIIDLTAGTTIQELSFLIKKASCVITNDSAVLHIASYINTPTVAIFGPTNEAKYGPWSEINAIVKRDLVCRPCEKAQCGPGTLKCMQLIKVEDVLKAIRNTLAAGRGLSLDSARNALRPQAAGSRELYKRILIVRTDKIGDVLLSTPVIKALRENYPNAYIAMMVCPYTKDIVEDNPYLDEVIIYDKDGKHKKWRRSLKFARNLAKIRFDLALILHPTNRVHLVTFLAGIPRRIGYDRKLGFLLTHRIKHTKQLGEKHESQYCLDLLKYIGIESQDSNLLMPIKQPSQDWVDELFKQQGIKDSDRLLAIHPGASCPSRIWPNQRFAGVADRLIKKYGFKVFLIAGPKEIALVENLMKNMRNTAVNLAGKTSLSQAASLLKRCQLFISNDSGPVHMAVALGVPVISISGRNQKGLSPKRWGPLGKKDRVLHKEVGCVKCLAHNCRREFACLKAITIDEVIEAADSILR
ncbi:MAG: lipopolysaccharide heptosyltransferase II, partial [Omnitrophica WOR_2 bacterium RBG_13_44_8b]